ncbi:hypothetical protein [Psychrobacter sp. ENNN9_III]|uniref:hypothetical protein n=1 Tax=Psychrobacter sp. ENNN9_III TaxID=1254334 RepID=UPI000A92D2A7|nr:hypothetical protein [Psychrobacter sp. ENNN9_III]
MTVNINKSQQPVLGNDAVDSKTPQGEQWRASLWKFLLFSALGIALFIIPFQWDGKVTILLGVLTDALQAALGGYVAYIALAIVTTSFIGALAVKVLRPNLHPDSLLKKTLRCRLVVACCTFFRHVVYLDDFSSSRSRIYYQS